MASILAGAGISAIGSLIGGGKQASAIKQAATTQANAADYAANLTSEAEANSLNFTKQNYSNTEANEAPYQAAGTAAEGELASGTAPGGEFSSTPTADQVMAQDPGYAFQLAQGQLALERSEAAGGGVGSGGALKAGAEFGQNFAEESYGNALNEFNTNRQINYGDLSGVANEGLGANATVANAGTGASSTVANTSLTGAGTQGTDLMGGANATAAGGIGVANATAGTLSSIGTVAQQALQQSASGYQPAPNYGPGTAMAPGELNDWINGGSLGNIGANQAGE